MYILGIDTSCDDTSAAVLVDGRTVLSNIVNSQVKIHHPYGGVVPELASREHIRNIVPVVEEAISSAGIGIKEIDGIAVTIGPGLVGSLLVGLYYAKALSWANNIPLVAVNHLEGHVLSILLEKRAPEFPFLTLTVSGGHTSLYNVKGRGDYLLMGQTLDDAAGEAFDKIAKMLGLGYPGGPIIEEKARKGRKDRIDFPRAHLAPESFDFSFSGLKTSVSLFIGEWIKNKENQGEIEMEDIAASFQEAVIDALVQKLLKARNMTDVHSMVLSGGVACNKALRRRLIKEAEKDGSTVYYARPEYCTDNGAMIALAGYYRMIHGERADYSIDVRSRYPMEDLALLGGKERNEAQKDCTILLPPVYSSEGGTP